MIGMTFASFLTLLVIGAVCAFVFHNILKARVLRVGGYWCDLIIGWIGSWIGSAVVGHWSWAVPDTNVYLVPAIIGSLAAIYALLAFVRIVESLLTPLSLRETLVSAIEKDKAA
jgi:uncharacterized membrane protein YeaQ/YmgE (transglycosylase-associated protein family)